MHSTSVGTSGVPAFLVKLWKLVEDRDYDDLICWNSNGTSFFIRDQPRFSRDLLPLYFKHSNMASFIRQLNMYGFRKVVSIESGGLRVDKDEMEFQHNCFLKGNANLLECIKRKVPAGKSSPPEEAKPQPDLVNKMLFDVKYLHGKQENLNSKLDGMKRENETLWREIATLRQQHMKQQQIIQKLIQFFISFVQPNRGMGVSMKRKMPLMLNSSSHSEPKCGRLSRAFSYEPASGSDAQKTASPSASVLSAVGPVIHDITDIVDAESFLNTGSEAASRLTGSSGTSSPAQTLDPVVDSPGPSSSSTVDRADESSFRIAAPESLEAAKELTLEAVTGVVADLPAKPSNLDEFFKEIGCDYPAEPSPSTEDATSSLDKTLSKVDLTDHIETVNLELDALKDMFSSGDFTIDASTLMGLFSMDDMLPGKGLSEMGDFGKLSGGNEIVGNELTQFTAGAFDLDDPDVTPYSAADLGGDSSALTAGQGDLYDYVSGVVALDDDHDRGASSAPAPLSTDLTLTPDLDLFLESPVLLAEDVAASPGRRKENSSET